MEPESRPSPLRMAWKVGDLARLTGLTVRTLHHYEEIGLLVTAARMGHNIPPGLWVRIADHIAQVVERGEARAKAGQAGPGTSLEDPGAKSGPVPSA